MKFRKAVVFSFTLNPDEHPEALKLMSTVDNNNQFFRDLLTNYAKGKIIDKGDIKDRIDRQILVEKILKNWKSGKEIGFSPAQMKAVMTGEVALTEPAPLDEQDGKINTPALGISVPMLTPGEYQTAVSTDLCKDCKHPHIYATGACSDESCKCEVFRL